MAIPKIHPDWDRAPNPMAADGYSLEMTAKDIAGLTEAAPLIAPGTPVAVTFLPGEEAQARVEAAKAVRALGFEPMPHFSARRIPSREAFENYLQAVVREAEVRRTHPRVARRRSGKLTCHAGWTRSNRLG